MARPKKQGVDYFPLDVHLDNKMKFLIIKFGLEGLGAIATMFQEVYANGYWCKWGEDEKLIFTHENNISIEKLNKIVEEALARDIFDIVLFNEFQILTSSGIQKRYKKIVERRKDVEIIRKYTLIDGNFGVNDDIILDECIHDDDINDTSSKVNDNISTQSKVKDSKVKDSKVEESTSDQSKFIKILSTVPLYPLDDSKDIEMYNTLIDEYPTIDIIQGLTDWKIYKLDIPLDKNSRARGQISNHFKNLLKWNKCKKKKTIIEIEDQNPFRNK